MEKIVFTATVEVDEANKKAHICIDCDHDFPDEWDQMSMAEKIAATFHHSAGEVVKSVIEHESQKEPPSDEPCSSGLTYPCRCRIIDPEGEVVAKDATHEAIALANPSVAVPKVGRTGTAFKEGPTVRIELDDGSTLMGYECWWKPIADVN